MDERGKHRGLGLAEGQGDADGAGSAGEAMDADELGLGSRHGGCSGAVPTAPATAGVEVATTGRWPCFGEEGEDGQDRIDGAFEGHAADRRGGCRGAAEAKVEAGVAVGDEAEVGVDARRDGELPPPSMTTDILGASRGPIRAAAIAARSVADQRPHVGEFARIAPGERRQRRIAGDASWMPASASAAVKGAAVPAVRPRTWIEPRAVISTMPLPNRSAAPRRYRRRPVAARRRKAGRHGAGDRRAGVRRRGSHGATDTRSGGGCIVGALGAGTGGEAGVAGLGDFETAGVWNRPMVDWGRRVGVIHPSRYCRRAGIRRVQRYGR